MLGLSLTAFPTQLPYAVSQPGSTKLLQAYLKHGGSPSFDIGLETSAIDHARRAGWNVKVKLLEKASNK